MISIDWLTIIIEKKEELTFLDDQVTSSHPFKIKIEQWLKIFFNINTWKASLFEHDSATMLTRNKSYQLNLTGKFFLEKDSKERLEKLILKLRGEGYRYHFTRIDIANTVQCKMKDIERDIRKIKTKDLKTVEYKRKENLEYFACFNNRFSFVIYDKSLQIKQKMKKNLDYKTKFYEKFNFSAIDSICRFECRIKGADTCSVITYSDDFFNEIKTQYYLQIEKRIDLSKNIKKIIKNSPFIF